MRKDKTIREIRKEAVVNTFFDTIKRLSQNNPLTTHKEAIERAVQSAAPRFFVTYENAQRLISLMARKKPLPKINKNKIEMYKEIFRRYMKQCKGRYGRYEILESILQEPAPSFYLDANTFQGILYKTLRERRIYTPQAIAVNTDIL